MEQSELDKLSIKLQKSIDKASVDIWEEGPRWHLGASVIGAECQLQLWLSYRWVYMPVHHGRLYRLFDRGHREEDAIDRTLRAAGWTVHVPTAETKHQFRVSHLNGHFGGTADGVATHPDYIGGTPFLIEKKTHNTAQFSKLHKEGSFRIAKPAHWTQASLYGYGLGLGYGLYYPVNKNDDDIRPEFFATSVDEAEEAIRKAEAIINAKTKPKPIAGASPTHFICKMCDGYSVCQSKKEEPHRNCRSCVYSKPVENAEWSCDHYGLIPRDKAILGCAKWESVFVR